MEGSATYCVEGMKIHYGFNILSLVRQQVDFLFHCGLKLHRVQHEPLAILSLHKRTVSSYIEWAHFEATSNVHEGLCHAQNGGHLVGLSCGSRDKVLASAPMQ